MKDIQARVQARVEADLREQIQAALGQVETNAGTEGELGAALEWKGLVADLALINPGAAESVAQEVLRDEPASMLGMAASVILNNVIPKLSALREAAITSTPASAVRQHRPQLRLIVSNP
ncbi:MAG: hypothetical protein SFW62_09325 [Alphaproteobacteria bacterium]|nr:hypothetical protein [Alphaproteobacteria bacterium]